MSNIAIKVENISKRYRIGLKDDMHDTFVGAISSWIKSPFSNFKKLRSLSAFSENEVEEDIVWALKDISFEVKHGDILGIIGRNGAGKSTLLKIISRITEPSSGKVTFNGRVSSLLEVGTGFHPELTGRENIYLNGTVLGMTKREIDRKFDEIVAFAEVDKFLDTPIKRYSSGMKVRLAFAVAAHLEPEILLVDEVLSVGDAAFQKKCLGKMGDIANEGRTILFVSHNMAVIQSLCPKVFWIDNGMLRLQGDAAKAVKEYLVAISDYPTKDSPNEDLTQVVRKNGLKPIFIKGSLNNSPLLQHHIIFPKKTCEFQFILHAPELMKQCTIGIHFENEIGIIVYAVNTRWFFKKIDLLKGIHTIQCVIPKLPLVPGHYYLSLGFSSNNKQVDWIGRASQLEICATDVYGTGELPRSNQGFFLAEAKWYIPTVKK